MMLPDGLISYGRDGRAVNPDRPARRVIRTVAADELPFSLESEIPASHTERMSDINREEVKARLEASEARVATAVEGMRADAAQLRGDLRVGIGDIKAQGDAMKAEAASFYAEARTVLTEIRLAQEQSKNTAYAIGYKVIVWAVGTVIALAGLALGGYNALKKPAPQAVQSTSEQAKPVQQPQKP